MSGAVPSDFGGAFKGRHVLVTGHTGFKGGWISHWLMQLGARVSGIALAPEPGPNLCDATKLTGDMDSRLIDIRDREALLSCAGDIDADLVIHMAAQPFVRRSYAEPAATIATNVSGTAHVLDLARNMPSLKAVVVVTSDKCYENNEWGWGYRENDPMGGSDPYSASKGATELIAQSYRRSFFHAENGPQLATVRAGNVFGGGDWGEDRLIPDIVRAVAAGDPVQIRNPHSIRPWQHVLEPLSGYLALAAKLLTDGAPYSEGWNFGPDVSDTVDVRTLAGLMQHSWGPGGPQFEFGNPAVNLHEAGILRLDSTKAQTRLGWRPQLDLARAVLMTVDWYRAHLAVENMKDFTLSQIAHYGDLMDKRNHNNAPVAAQ
ncbi:CDP-glucose 4,6-dehydratase [Aliiroseovarius pelagivivens]|uniref:CDP-glucose 4,6-dehydratase n=1 Tax=Aliiroseovarius pelagivivens TaxID=1639690 RepID=A0A2R8ALK6_9RHOB|nr:CDP-glucose 4,6-dehydratase [Aliiroseovarius pelagivivens]SPF76922.1 CDP-glucose 4,6-dehydratase [Aliiroseovarius pelagivivens]